MSSPVRRRASRRELAAGSPRRRRFDLGRVAQLQAALQRADELRAAGVIVASLAPELRGLAGSLRTAVLVVEGFGSLPMSAPVMELLSALNGQEGALNARFQPRGRGASQPELFVPLAESRMQQSGPPCVKTHEQ